MPKRYTLYFLLMIAVISSVMYLAQSDFNRAMTKFDAGLNSQMYIAVQQREVAIAQEYANELAFIARMEAQRAHTLEGSLRRVQTMYMTLYQEFEKQQFLEGMRTQMYQGYINQLTDVLEQSGIEVPAPDPEKFGDPDDPAFSIQIQDDPAPAPPAEDN